jgi:hypothetical protein
MLARMSDTSTPFSSYCPGAPNAWGARIERSREGSAIGAILPDPLLSALHCEEGNGLVVPDHLVAHSPYDRSDLIEEP